MNLTQHCIYQWSASIWWTLFCSSHCSSLAFVMIDFVDISKPCHTCTGFFMKPLAWWSLSGANVSHGVLATLAQVSASTILNGIRWLMVIGNGRKCARIRVQCWLEAEMADAPFEISTPIPQSRWNCLKCKWYAWKLIENKNRITAFSNANQIKFVRFLFQSIPSLPSFNFIKISLCFTSTFVRIRNRIHKQYYWPHCINTGNLRLTQKQPTLPNTHSVNYILFSIQSCSTIIYKIYPHSKRPARLSILHFTWIPHF